MRKLILGLLLLPGLLWGAERELLLVVDINDSASGYKRTLLNMSRNAIDSLRDYRVSEFRVDTRPTDVDQLNIILNQAKDVDLTAFAVVTVDLKRRNKAEISTAFYEVETGSIILKNDFELRYNDIRALMAQLEYQLTRRLKQELSEIGGVIRKEDGQVFFDLGRNAGVKVGDIFKVYTVGDEILAEDNESYGFLDQQTGVVEVSEVTGIYSVAKIMLGQQTIKANHFVELADGSKQDYQGRVLAKHDNKVAINLGRQAGVSKGAYFAVYKELKPVKDGTSFRQMIGKIRISEVEAQLATGEVARSDSYDLVKELIEEGSLVEEVPASAKNMLVLGQLTSNSNAAASSVYYLGWQGESSNSMDIFYRLRVGMDDQMNLLGSWGIMSAINHSESFYYGVDLVYADSMGTSLFLGTDIPTPFSSWMKLNTELDYIVGDGLSLSGLAINLSARFNVK